MRNREREIAQAKKNNVKKITNDSATQAQATKPQATPTIKNTYSNDDIEKLLLIM
jgi:hypothetical protein